jgi:tetratricopeptide (TPR) repeat protein
MRKLILLLALMLIPIFPIFAVEAIDALDNITENNSGVVDTKSVDARAWFLEGNALYDQKKYDESLDAYNEAIQLEPGNVSIWSNKGNVLYDLKRYRDSVDACDEAIRLDPKDAIAWVNKGNALEKLDSFQEALDCYNEALKLDPTLKSAKNNKAFLLGFHGIDIAIAQDKRDAAEEKAMANQTNDEAVQDVIIHPTSVYRSINDTTPRFSAVQGKYDATQVTVPLGPYQISFSTRLENITFAGVYDALGYNKTAGSGKEYHTCTYDKGDLDVLQNGTYGEMYPIRFTIYRYVSPSSYPPIDPDPNGMWELGSLIDSATMTRDYSGPDSITIDGQQGTLITGWTTWHNYDYDGEEHSTNYDRYTYIATYQPNDNTYVVVKFDDSIDYDKDVALVLETLHITEV